MLQLQLTLDDLDFDALVEQFLPQLTDQFRASGNPIGMLLSNGMTAGMAKNVLHTLSPEKKEQLLADMINANQSKISAKIEKTARNNGVYVRVVSATAQVP